MRPIRELLQKLAKKLPIFHSEADFQLSLFRLLSKETGVQNIHLKSFTDKKYHIDIVVSGSPVIAIEVKYSPKSIPGGHNSRRKNFALYKYYCLN